MAYNQRRFANNTMSNQPTFRGRISQDLAEALEKIMDEHDRVFERRIEELERRLERRMVAIYQDNRRELHWAVSSSSPQHRSTEAGHLDRGKAEPSDYCAS